MPLLHAARYRNLAAHLALALAYLIMRCPRWPAATLIQDVAAMFIPSSSASSSTLHLHISSHPTPAGAAALAAAAAHGSGGSGALTLLCVLGALPEAAASRHCLVPPDRRGALLSVLKTSPWPAPLICAALRARSVPMVTLACLSLQTWCSELGAPPAGLAADPEALEIAVAALMAGDTHQAAADCIVALFDACRESAENGGRSVGGGGGGADAARSGPSGSSSGSSGSRGQDDGTGMSGPVGPSGLSPAAATAAGAPVTPPELLEKLLSALETHLMPVIAAAGHDGSVTAAATAAGAVGLTPACEATFCSVLSAAASALLAPALAAGGSALSLLQRLQSRLLAALSQPDGGAVLGALLFWQNVYLVTLQKLPREAVTQLAAGPQRGMLEALVGALVARTRLAPDAAAAATADARDLPEDLRAVSGGLLGLLVGWAAGWVDKWICGWLGRRLARRRGRRQTRGTCLRV